MAASSSRVEYEGAGPFLGRSDSMASHSAPMVSTHSGRVISQAMTSPSSVSSSS